MRRVVLAVDEEAVDEGVDARGAPPTTRAARARSARLGTQPWSSTAPAAARRAASRLSAAAGPGPRPGPAAPGGRSRPVRAGPALPSYQPLVRGGPAPPSASLTRAEPLAEGEAGHQTDGSAQQGPGQQFGSGRRCT